VIIVYVTVPGILPVAVTVCTGIVLVPLGINPVAPDPVAVHENELPKTFEVSVTREVAPPEQIVWANGEFVTVGTSEIVTAPEAVITHPFASVTTSV
jgi:hypothetical protein